MHNQGRPGLADGFDGRPPPAFFGGSRTQKMREHSHCTVVSSCFSTAWRLSPQLGHLNAPRVRCFGFGTRT